CPTTFHYGTS
ncbi:unnamed protein product, partial [Allacma fusca]